MIVPFTREGETAAKVGASVINLFIGLCIGSLLTAVLSRTVLDAERSWQWRLTMCTVADVVSDVGFARGSAG